jgi:monoamine oxidase
MPSVIIIGAGTAGLYAALELQQKHGIQDVIVLEARQRVGGRTHSELMDSHMVDAGGQWIGPPQRRVNELVARYGLSLNEQFQTGKHVLEHQKKCHYYSNSLSDLDIGAQQLGDIWNKLDAMASEIDVSRPWLIDGATELDNISVSDWLHRNCSEETTRRLVEWFVLVCMTTSPSKVSLLCFLTWLKSGGLYASLANIDNGAQNHTVIGGMQQLSERMASELPADCIRLGCIVKKVVRQPDKVDVIYAVNDKEEILTASRVVLALSPTLASKIEIDPSPSRERIGLSNDMQMGRVNKVIISFGKPWWRDLGFSGKFMSNEGPFSLGYDRSYPKDNFYALVAFCAAEAAETWNTKTAEQRQSDAIEQLSRMFGYSCEKDLITFSEHDWHVTEPEFSGGCYFAVRKIGSIIKWKDALSKPIENQIFFAGTETAHEWIGYIEGSLESGERVAKEVAAAAQASQPML